MKLCAIVLGCVVGFGLPMAYAQTTRPATKKVVGKPRPKVQPRQQAPEDSGFQEEMNDAAAGSAVQPTTRRYVAPPPPETYHVLGDLVYQTPASYFRFDVDFRNVTSNSELRSNSFQLSSTKSTSQILGAGVEYGLFHHAALGLEWEYQLSGNEDTTVSGGTTSRVQQIGYEEPTIYGSYQIMDQDEGPLNLIVRLAYSPKLGNAKIGTTTTNGNALRGSDAFVLEGALGRKFSAGELGGSLIFASIGNSTTENASSSNLQGGSDGVTRFGAQIAGRTGFSIFHLGAAVRLLSTGSYSGTSTSGTKSTVPQNSVFSYIGFLDFDIVRDVCFFQVTYSMTPSYTYDATVTNSTVNVKADSNTLGAKLSLLF